MGELKTVIYYWEHPHKYVNFTWTTLNYCEIKDFSWDIYTWWCYDTLFIPSKIYSWDSIYLTWERIDNWIIYNWRYGQFGDACYSWDNIQWDIIDCWLSD